MVVVVQKRKARCGMFNVGLREGSCMIWRLESCVEVETE